MQVLLRRRGLTPDYVPPISVVLAADKDAYLVGLTDFREGRENRWLETAARAAELATGYLMQVRELQKSWREAIDPLGLRVDSAAWLLIDLLPGHPIVSQPVAVEATGRSRPVIQHAIDQLVEVGVLLPLSSGKRNRQWEAAGLLDLSAEFERLGTR